MIVAKNVNYFNSVDYDVDTHILNLLCCTEHCKDATVRHNSYCDLCEQKFVAYNVVQRNNNSFFVKMYEMG